MSTHEFSKMHATDPGSTPLAVEVGRSPKGGPGFGGLLLAIVLGISCANWGVAAEVFVPPADTSSPRATLDSFIDSCNEMFSLIQEERYLDRSSSEHRPLAKRILDCLDTRELPEFERYEIAGEAAVCLKEILDRIELPPESEIPDVDMIEAAGGIEEFARWTIPGTRITIARVEEGPQRHEYLFSPGTVGRAVEYYEDLESLPYLTTDRVTSPGLYTWFMTAPGNPTIGRIVDRLPDWFRERSLGMAHWKWVGLVIAIVIADVLIALAYWLHTRYAGRYRHTSPGRYFLTIVFPIAAMLIPIGFKTVATDYLTVRGDQLYVISFIANLVALLASIVVVFGTGNRIAALIIASPQINPQGLDAQFIRILSRILSILASSIIFLEGGRYLGIPISTLLASAGIGGLAVALAAQDTLKNLFGTIMLLTDKPFRVGERILFKNYDGVVEDIGLRSTKVRLLTGHQVILPNDELARTDIENVGRRLHIRRTAVLEIPAATSVAKIRRALEIVRAALENHEGMRGDFPPRVYLRDFKESSVGIFFIYWYHPPNYWDFLAFSERVNLEILERLESEQIPFALPAISVQMSDADDRAA